MNKIPVGVVGATGMVGQRFVTLLKNHPWFEVTVLAASPNSAGKRYMDAVSGRWAMPVGIPDYAQLMVVRNGQDVADVTKEARLVFCAVDMPKNEVARLEEAYAQHEVVAVSANSAHRWTPDVPMIIPEINCIHLGLIPAQQKRLGTKRGFIVVKPNCSVQPYMLALRPLQTLIPEKLSVSTYQAVSGAGQTRESWPEMDDNIIPFISGEEEKSEQEPLKIWGDINLDKDDIYARQGLAISAQCVRVPVSDGHLVAIQVAFRKNPTSEEIIRRWREFKDQPQILGLPSAPDPVLIYREEDNRPQTKLDRNAGNGMAITLGRLRKDPIFDWKFVALSHNTIRGAAGGAVLTAEMLKAYNWLD